MVASITPGSLEYHCTEMIINTLKNLASEFKKPIYKNHAQHWSYNSLLYTEEHVKL